MKVSKNIKFKCRVRTVKKEKIDKLYEKTNKLCVECQHDCKNENTDTKYCANRKQRMDINEIIEMLKNENVNMFNLCEKYSLKLDILVDMLRGNRILNYKYYICILDSLHMVKDRFEMNQEYQQMNQDKDGVDI